MFCFIFSSLLIIFNIIGCGKCYTVDGNWKLTFPHCMFPVKSRIIIPGLNFANVCPSQPLGNKAFCKLHIPLAESAGYPCNVKEFVKYCGANSEFIIIIIIYKSLN